MDILILKIGGKLIASEALLDEQLDQFVRHKGAKLLVHGGGVLGDQMLKKTGVPSGMSEGRRITSPECLEILTMVYSGLSQRIAAKLVAKGLTPLCLSGSSGFLLEAQKRSVDTFDFGEVGDLVRLRSDLLVSLLHQGFIPVISPLTCDCKGHLLNTNADAIGGFIASSLSRSGHKVSLSLSFELNGILSDIDDSGSQIPVLNFETYQRMLKNGQLSHGILPKTQEGFLAKNAGVCQVTVGKFRSECDGMPTRLEV